MESTRAFLSNIIEIYLNILGNLPKSVAHLVLRPSLHLLILDPVRTVWMPVILPNAASDSIAGEVSTEIATALANSNYIVFITPDPPGKKIDPRGQRGENCRRRRVEQACRSVISTIICPVGGFV